MRLTNVIRSVLLILPLVRPGALPSQTLPPVISDGGVVNTADYTPAISPGSLIAIFGSNLAPDVIAASTIPLPVSLGGVSVLIDDRTRTVEAPLFFVSPGQVNAQMPYGLARADLRVSIRTAAGTSNAVECRTVPAAPKLFTWTQDGKGEAILLHADFSLVSEEAPAAPGEVVILYLTGLGGVTPPVVAGAAAGDGGAGGPLSSVTANIQVTVQGHPATVWWAGLAPYFAGLYQVNLQVPAQCRNMSSVITVSAGAGASQQTVYTHVRDRSAIVANGTVSAQGGTVQGAGIAVAIPQGAFPNENRIVVENTGPAPRIGVATPHYRMTGLPANWEQPLTVSLQLTEGISPSGRSYLLMQETGAGLSAAMVLDARVEGNRIIGEIPASRAEPGAGPAGLRAAAAPGPGLTLWAVTGWYSSTSASRRFEITYPAADLVTGAADVLLAALDEAYGKIEALGLSWANRTSWPVRATIETFEGAEAQRVAHEIPSRFGDNSWQVSFNERFLQDASQTELWKITAGHELFHLMQRLYDPRNRISKARNENDWFWYKEALSTWFERRKASDSSYIPSTVRYVPGSNNSSDNYAFLRSHGLEYPYSGAHGAASAVQEHGYGASMYLQHLSNAKGENAVADVLKLMATPGAGIFGGSLYSPVQAIDRVSGDVGMSWRRFCESYMAGTVYNRSPMFPGPGEILGKSLRYLFRTEKDVSGSFRWNAQDLSANLVTLDFRPEGGYVWPKDSQLIMELVDPSGESEAILYKRTPKGDWQQLQIFKGEYTIENAEELANENHDLVIMLANGRAVRPYTGTHEIEFKFRREEQTQGNSYSQTWDASFYNDTWTINLTMEITTATGVIGNYLDRLVMGGSIRQLLIPVPPLTPGGPQSDDYTIRVTLNSIKPKGSRTLPENHELVVYGTFESNTKTEGTQFSKTVTVKRGDGRLSVNFAVILYWRPKAGDEIWEGGDSLTYIYFLPPADIPKP